jgi:hydrogenase nickel incorporation protein HypA/HybF
MHELAIAESVARTVLEEMQRRSGQKLVAVGLRIGEFSDVVPESLQFGFDVITKGGPLDGVRFHIERTELRARCRSCGEQFRVNDLNFECPVCGSRDIEIVSGRELEIAYLEIDDESPATSGEQNVQGDGSSTI